MPVSAAEGPNKLFISQIQSSGGSHYTPDPHTIQTETSKHPNYMYISGGPICKIKLNINMNLNANMNGLYASQQNSKL